ncbi:50S ribosomal protein L35ae [Candidatus Woesearchaeota archaeon]|nr:MAG: 50S ribosomal protein L35ae [Candidatus Woesearchaeota archaeon]
MKGTIVNFRGGRHTQYNNQMLIAVEGINSKDKATELIGKEVSWKSPAGREIKGKISATHGSKGIVRAIFEKGMPGQSISQKVEIK